MIKELVSILEGICSRMEKLETVVETLAVRIDRAASVLDVPTGHVVMNSIVKTTPQEIEQAFRNSARAHMECVQLDMQFSSAVYLALTPDSKERMAKLFNEAQIENIKTVLEMHQRMAKMADAMESRMQDIDEIMKKTNAKLVYDIEAVIRKTTDVELKRMQDANDDFTKKMRILDKAFANIELAIERAKAAEARSKARVESSTPVQNKFAGA